MLKVINGDRDALEVEALRTIWLGSKENADKLIGRLKRDPNIKLRLVSDVGRSSKIRLQSKMNKTSVEC